MSWPLGEAAQLSSDCCPDQLYEKPVPKKQGSGGTEAKNSVWEWGKPRLWPIPGPPVLMPEYANPKHR